VARYCPAKARRRYRQAQAEAETYRRKNSPGKHHLADAGQYFRLEPMKAALGNEDSPRFSAHGCGHFLLLIACAMSESDVGANLVARTRAAVRAVWAPAGGRWSGRLAEAFVISALGTVAGVALGQIRYSRAARDSACHPPRLNAIQIESAGVGIFGISWARVRSALWSFRTPHRAT